MLASVESSASVSGELCPVARIAAAASAKYPARVGGGSSLNPGSAR